MNAETQQNLHEQLARLQEALSTRQSTLLFAHAGVSFVLAFILGGATGKLFWDSARAPYVAWLGLAVTLGLAVYGLMRYRQGRTVLADELVRYETMLELRRRLGLDNPTALLPR
ncbi:hypothetical protein [Archangium sp.]|uniref:hypothetical protein n=1 Tax=Archangium sp. TaxID=1872627 RepID=UPI002D40A4BA|nr:hypothetical protein [Archangium sp.]HYO59160.1 hypothetical protein [Archangium sp.]